MITPIETSYAGCRFRSRLEARWAVFFDALGIRWEYEPQGYTVGPGKRPYLPDFWLPDLGSGTWVEVKGDDEHLDIPLLEAAAGRDGLGRSNAFYETQILVLGPIPKPGPAYTHAAVLCTHMPPCVGMCDSTHALYTEMAFVSLPKVKPVDADVDDETFRKVRHLGALLVQWGRQHYRPTDMRPDGALVKAMPNRTLAHDLSVQAAYQAARRARFEHGEAGAA